MNVCVILDNFNISYQDLMTQEFYADIKDT
jgi:hypothetical protein